MRRGHLASATSVGASPPTSHRSRGCISAVLIFTVMGIVVTMPPMKAKVYLATDTGDVAEVQRILDANQRQQVLEDHDDSRSGVVSEVDPDRQQDAAMGTGIAAGGVAQNQVRRKVDLTLYVVFHKTLLSERYSGMDWKDIAYPASNGQGQPTSLDTASIVSALATPGGMNRTTIIFVATNKNIRKRYNPDLVRGRLINEWELPGYDTRIGTAMNEYGAMNSIFSSQLTQHAGNIANVAGRGLNPRLVAADADGDGVQEWIGIFQYDMHIDKKLIQMIRRRIRSRTAAAVTTLKTLNSRGGEAIAAGRGHEAWRRKHHDRLHCCIFYGVSYPTKYLLHNALGRKLLEDYNTFFVANYVLSDMPPVGILDAFVVPSIVFNHFAPFLESVMLRVIRSPGYYPPKPGRTTSPASSLQRGQPSPVSTVPTVGVDGGATKLSVRIEHALDVMEAALALSLGLETSFVQVQLPLRHKSWDD